MMKIKCRNCAKIYSVPANHIGKSGRTVKCTGCGFIWYVNLHEKRGGHLVLAVLACIMVCFVVASPDTIKKPYKHLINNLIGNKKEQNIDVSQFYQDYFLLSNIKPYNTKTVKEG